MTRHILIEPNVQFIDYAPRVFLVGSSQPIVANFDKYLRYRKEMWSGSNLRTSECIAEAAGRVCYQSWTNPSQKSTEEYLQQSIVEHRHGSVLEHVWFNFLVADLPRSSQLELVRHGDGTAFSFESTRFTNKYMRFVIPPLLRDNADLFKYDCMQSHKTYMEMIGSLDVDDYEGTLKRKRRLEAARAVLPNALGSDGMVSMNARALRWITEVRSDEHADLSIREFAAALFTEAKPYLQGILADGVLQDNGEIKYKVSKV